MMTVNKRAEGVENSEQLALRVKDFCERVGISHSTFWKYVGLGKIRVVRIGGRVLIPAAEAVRILAEGVR
jgi:excisionase family DNA binding protein